MSLTAASKRGLLRAAVEENAFLFLPIRCCYHLKDTGKSSGQSIPFPLHQISEQSVEQRASS